MRPQASGSWGLWAPGLWARPELRPRSKRLSERLCAEELISALAGALAIGAGQGRAAGGESAIRTAEGRHHLDPGVVKKAVKRAVGGAGVSEEASWHSFRHCQWLRHAGQAMPQTSWREARSSAPSRSCLGHRDANTTMICPHVLNLRPLGVRSPADLVYQPEHVVNGSDNQCSR